MRVNIYAEELTDRVEIVQKVAEGTTYFGIRFYLELPVRVQGKQYRGPFKHRPGDDDSAAVTFWSHRKKELRNTLLRAANILGKPKTVRRAKARRQGK